jgi:hypothetical protein
MLTSRKGCALLLLGVLGVLTAGCARSSSARSIQGGAKADTDGAAATSSTDDNNQPPENADDVVAQPEPPDSGVSRADSGSTSRIQPDASAPEMRPSSVMAIDAALAIDAEPERDAGVVEMPPASVVTSMDAAVDGQIDALTDAGIADAMTTPDAASDAGLCGSCGGCEEKQPTQAGIHTTDPIDYPDPPPTSGPHNPCWARWGVYDTAVAAERWVHNLEHGGVVFLYNCPQGCPADVDTLKQLISTHRRTVLTAYDKLPKRFAVVSWGHRLVTDCVDEAAFNAFYAANFDHGAESNDSQPDVSCPP